MRITKPNAGVHFSITVDAVWPSVVFETDVQGPTSWTWTIVWASFRRTGSANTAGNVWDATSALTGLGGTLTVNASAKGGAAAVTVKLSGKNPTSFQLEPYLAAKPNALGFNKIIAQESKGIHFNAAGEPIRSFDGGYGICQLTNPPPTYEQVWNWKANVDAGLQLFAQKRAAAIAYLSQSQRSYSVAQLTRETVCRWNGGAYYVWNTQTAAWVRPANILCDTRTGNIGWDLNDPANAGHTLEQLHARDRGSYAGGHTAGSHWKYLGVCYADHVLG